MTCAWLWKGRHTAALAAALAAGVLAGCRAPEPPNSAWVPAAPASPKQAVSAPAGTLRGGLAPARPTLLHPTPFNELTQLDGGPGLIVFEPVNRGADGETAAFSAGCARCLHL